jgi:hypothetical protein
VSLRERINQNPKLGIGLGAGILIIAIIFAVVMMRGNGPTMEPSFDTTKAFFTDDDGKTYFPAEIKVPPFDHNGKKAYRARVFVDSHGQRFVGWLESYDETARKRIQKLIDDTKELPDRAMGEAAEAPSVKKPGAAKWVTPKTHDEYIKVVTPDPPDHNMQGIKIAIPTKEDLKKAAS